MFDQNILLKSIIKFYEIHQCGLKADNSGLKFRKRNGTKR